jgi:GTPase Era involved in 16S rRNA processing
MYYLSSSQNYPERFNKIYSLSKQFSSEFGMNFDEVFNEAVRFHDSQNSEDQIREQLQRKKYQFTSRMNLSAANTNYSVWLTFGETGQGKSAFTNAICGGQVAVEGKGIKSKTENIGLYASDKHQIIMIDTPGLFDTRRIRNREISNKVVEIVQNQLKQNAHIDAIFFLWCPTSSMRLRFEEILGTLKKALGDEAIDSVIFLINKVTKHWDQDSKDLCDQFLDLLYENGLENPVFECDLKQMTPEAFRELKNLPRNVHPYREEDFEAHRMVIYLNKFLEIQRRDEEKKREREKIEREVEEKRRKEEDERKRREEEERIQQEQRRREEEARAAQSYYSFYYSTPTPIQKTTTTSPSASPEGMKFYKGGQFIPGGGHAPKGGCYMQAPSSSSHPPNSSNSGGSGGTFYKGGQFMPGGGRAPKGGAWK